MRVEIENLLKDSEHKHHSILLRRYPMCSCPQKLHRTTSVTPGLRSPTEDRRKLTEQAPQRTRHIQQSWTTLFPMRSSTGLAAEGDNRLNLL